MNGAWPGLLNRDQVCIYLGIGETKLRELICDRSLKAVTMPKGKELRFRLIDLDKFINGLDEIDSSKVIRERQKLTEAARKVRLANQISSQIAKHGEVGAAEAAGPHG